MIFMFDLENNLKKKSNIDADSHNHRKAKEC